MRNIEVALLSNPGNLNFMPSLARLTQHGHEVSEADDLRALFAKDVSKEFRQSLATMPHGTIKRFNNYTVAVVGASRRFLAQIRTHQHINFVSGSLQYSDWSETQNPEDMFVVPYELLDNKELQRYYLDGCVRDFQKYKVITKEVGNDAAGYILPNGMRNILVMQANMQEWQYVIGLRTCKRNSPETRYVMYRIWEALYNTTYGPDFFSVRSSGSWCQTLRTCLEGKMTCGQPLSTLLTPTELLKQEFPLLMKES